MFGIFSKNTIEHSLLGEIRYGFGKWKGSSARLFESDSVEVRVPGNKAGPFEEALSGLVKLIEQYPSLKNELAHTLFYEHYMHGKADSDSRENQESPEDYPNIKNPNAVWDNVSVVRVWIDPYGNKGQIELAYGTEWDIEHTLGFTFKNCEVVEFSASVGP